MAVDKQGMRLRRSGGMEGALHRFTAVVHAFLYRLTGGTVGGKMGDRPILILTTIDRKSGKERVTPLLYLPEGNSFILVASN